VADPQAPARSNVRTASASELRALGDMVQAYHRAPELAALGALYARPAEQWQPPEPVMMLQRVINEAQDRMRGKQQPYLGQFQQLGIRG
jgi:hypothetical protein